jgi:hypothetical protein
MPGQTRRQVMTQQYGHHRVKSQGVESWMMYTLPSL